jgi:surface polysaccharide O-acyltransferase-like enzyme
MADDKTQTFDMFGINIFFLGGVWFYKVYVHDGHLMEITNKRK